MLVRKYYARRQLLIYVHSVTTLQTPDYMETSLLCTVCLVPGERKPLHFLYIQPTLFGHPTNTD